MSQRHGHRLKALNLVLQAEDLFFEFLELLLFNLGKDRLFLLKASGVVSLVVNLFSEILQRYLSLSGSINRRLLPIPPCGQLFEKRFLEVCELLFDRSELSSNPARALSAHSFSPGR